MYDELVNELRKAHKTATDRLENPYRFAAYYKAAADAIEELSAYARQIEELRKDGYYLQKTKMMTYGQATMTQPLPHPPKEEAT